MGGVELTVGVISSLVVVALVDRYRAWTQRCRNAERLVYELRFPDDFEHEAVLGAVLAMGGMLPPAGPESHGVSTIVFEAEASPAAGDPHPGRVPALS